MAGSQAMMYLFVELQQPPAPGRELHLGEVDVRWLTPSSRESNRQQLQLVASVSDWGDDPGFAFGGIVAMSTYLYGLLGDEPLPHESCQWLSWALQKLLQLFDQLPEQLRTVEANERFRRYLLGMVDNADRYARESSGPVDLEIPQGM